MKIFLFYLILSLSFFSLSQSKNTNNNTTKFILDIENDIIKSINEHRTNNNIILLERESVLDSASDYHNKYLKILNGDRKEFYITHTEYGSVNNLLYIGDNEIIKTSDERVLKFDKENKFNNVSEIIFVIGGLSNIIENPNKNSKKWSDYILKKWLDSKGHKYTVENNRLNKIGISVYFNIESNTLCVVSVLSNKKLD